MCLSFWDGCLTLSGWYEVLCTYSRLLVGLMCVLTSSSPVLPNLGPLYTVASKKVSFWLLCSNVNLIVGCILLISVIKSLSCSMEPSQMTKMSSMNPFHRFMFSDLKFCSLDSRVPMKRLA